MIDKITEWIKTNRIKVFGIVVLAAVTTLLYVDNTIKINDLLKDIREKEKEIQQVKTSQEVLKARIVELQSAERITRIAEDKLGLTKPNKVPTVIEVEE